MSAFQPGDIVVYAKEKHSTHPGPRARNVRPARRGEDYAYVVDKYWVVVSNDGERLELRTPGGKIHRIAPEDPHLRLATWRERIWLRLRASSRLHSLHRS